MKPPSFYVACNTKPIRQPCCSSLHNKANKNFSFPISHHLQTSLTNCHTDFSQNLSAHWARHTKKSRKTCCYKHLAFFPLPTKWKQFSTKKGGDIACLPSGFVTNLKVLKIRLIWWTSPGDPVAAF